MENSTFICNRQDSSKKQVIMFIVGEEMKKKFLNYSGNLLRKSGDYSEEKIEIILYGLEAVYLMITKMVVIFLLAYVLGILKETLILLISYNVIRSQAFGIHASKSIYCLISSILLFVGGALLCKYVTLPLWGMIVGAIVCNICLLLYAPADTHKRPLVNEKKRKRFKYVSFSLGIIYTVLIIVFRDYSIVNYLLFGMMEAVLMILPLTYKTFHLPYNNYKTYQYGV